MRKVLISAAAAVSAFAFAAPAAAQYYPAPPPPQAYGYNGYGYNGYGNNYGGVRNLQVRIDSLQQRINRFDSRDRVSEKEARRLRNESRDIERRLHSAARYGLNPREYASIDNRIRVLEQHIYRDVRDGRGWGRGGQWGYNNNGWVDRDRDGRNDRYEDDHGYRHD
jgi:hypothetical protein